ncbi:Fur family transcriptional regulator [Knoellia sp. CPCC 206450]|uniref:Fur family transcriptional regulator n=1 Tax=Knoellia tibetensis TaxID=3404798 RepID=UPI003B43B0D5
MSPAHTETAAGTAARRPTRQRAALAELMSSTTEFLSAQDLHARLQERGESVGLATVYRNLQAMAADGDVDVLRTDDGESVYRSCGTDAHHHHLVCRECGRTVEVEGPAVERWAAEVARRHGFSDVTHTIELFGTCTSH